MPWLLALLMLISRHELCSSAKITNHGNYGWRGGALPGQHATETEDTNDDPNNKTVEAYVAAMREKDRQQITPNTEPCDDDNDQEPSDTTESTEDAGNDASPSSDVAEEPAVVGVKSHNSKKSNAVGDPDGDDDDDDTDESLSEFSDEWEELEEFGDFVEELLVEPQLQVEVELVEESGGDEADEDILTDNGKPSGGGGVGVRLGRMNNRRGNRRNWRSTSSTSKLSSDQKRLLEAWTPHVYFPPTQSALAYLTEHARMLDASSKIRLDRRTLYAGLLMEWGCVETKLSSGSRKFFPSSVSQTLQAALSMATQPHWRVSSPRTSGIRLYQDEDTTSKSPTLSMQETVAMALVSYSKVNRFTSLCNMSEAYLFDETGTLDGLWTSHFRRSCSEQGET